MSDDKRRTPPGGIPRQPTAREIRETTPGRMAIVERGSGRSLPDRDRRRPPTMNPPFDREDLTPVSMLRAELKEDIDVMREDVTDLKENVDGLGTAVATLSAKVGTTNELMGQMMQTIRDELASRRMIEERVVMSQTEVTTHREMTQTDAAAADRAMSREMKLKIASWVFSAGGLGAIIAIIASKC